MDDLVVKWVIGRRTGERDTEGREFVEPEQDTASLTLDGLMRRLRKTLLEDDVVAVTIQIGEYDHVSDATRRTVHL